MTKNILLQIMAKKSTVGGIFIISFLWHMAEQVHSKT